MRQQAGPGGPDRVIQDGNHDNGIKAWVICPGFVDTAMGSVVPGANPAHFPTVEEVVDMARYLLRTGDSVKLGPQILLRTMRNPMGASTKGDRHDTPCVNLRRQIG